MNCSPSISYYVLSSVKCATYTAPLTSQEPLGAESKPHLPRVAGLEESCTPQKSECDATPNRDGFQL